MGLMNRETQMVEGPDFTKNDLIPVIAQSYDDGQVLMLAYMNREAYEETLRTRRVCYYSRSRQQLWRKGEQSGHVQELIDLFYDCDADAILVKVRQVGDAACHTGYRTCFYRRINLDTGHSEIVGNKVFDPQKVYTA